MSQETVGTVYLLHFGEKVRGTRHYVGFTQQALTSRLEQHRSGTFGSQLSCLGVKQGVPIELAKTWYHVPVAFEKQLKREKNLKRHCSFCQEAPPHAGPVPPEAG